ncbi:Uncharacterised protein [Porphyromonas cangingivalis]|uniref:hypothetical protein n=1 Tax=Porphyromonas cangingivalis TaxID=36874 RepID=UPI000D987762|nr:hypothetical protein [Porphyromonas cangingivalis]SPY35970.1 Uncharacterised protein [Porphyromonas cangingivalis]
MKKIIITLILAASSLFMAKAQDYKPEWQQVDTMTVTRMQAERRLAFVEKTNVIPMSFFIEAGGAGLSPLSFNFETRFARQLNGLGLRVGASFLGFGSTGIVTVPVQLTYLLGRRGNYFEIGAGATLFHGYSSLFRDRDYGPDSGKSKDTYTRLIGTTTFGYRYQPVKGGFMFRAGFAPFLHIEDGDVIFFPYMPYISLGYSF